MKNLLIFIHPRRHLRADYHKEMEFLMKVQIDNSLAFGWKREDIIIATNFKHHYNGVETIVVPDDTFSYKRRTVSKINAILALFSMGIITDELFWFHDFDAFQNAPLGDISLNDKVLGLTNTSVNDERVSTGIMFFSEDSLELFTAIQKICHMHSTNEEIALRRLIKILPNIMSNRLLLLNISHNFAIRKRNVADQYAAADKPIKVLHFHPYDNRFCSVEAGKTSLDVVYGNNSFDCPLISPTLRDTFALHGLEYEQVVA